MFNVPQVELSEIPPAGGELPPLLPGRNPSRFTPKVKPGLRRIEMASSGGLLASALCAVGETHSSEYLPGSASQPEVTRRLKRKYKAARFPMWKALPTGSELGSRVYQTVRLRHATVTED
jgi:hypothetical protein